MPTATTDFVPTDLDPADWPCVQPLIDGLLARAIDDADAAAGWLADASALFAVLWECGTRVNIAKACDTESDEVDQRFRHWNEQVDPELKKAYFALRKKLLASPGAAGLAAEDYAVLLRNWRADVELFREQNVPLQTKLTSLAADYDKLIGRMSAEIDGKAYTLPQLSRMLEDPDRGVRERAWRLEAEQRLAAEDAIDAILTEQVALRARVAENAGLDSYTQWAYRDALRFDYTPADCKAFAESIEAVCVPRVRALNDERRAKLGAETLRPWDTAVDPDGRPALEPFARDDASGLVRGCQRVFDELDPQLADDFRSLKDGRNLDLVSRPGKRSGGFQASLHAAGEPFIFMNAAGSQTDVVTMLHEAGHAFHFLAACRKVATVFARDTGAEFAEVASMSMELLGMPRVGVFYGGDEAASRRARAEHLEKIIRFFPWMAIVDQFQHWLYANPTHSVGERRAAWLALVDRFGTRHGGAGVDWSGMDDQLRCYWQRQIHIPHDPFYYVEYGIAQLGALQLWQQFRRDPKQALSDYKHALSLGGTRTLPELFAAAGLRFDFSRATLGPLIAEVDAARRALS